MIDTLCDGLDGGNAVVACIYCDFHAHKEQSATSVLAAILKQIVAGVELIPEEIQTAFDRAKREVDGRSLRLPEICAMLVNSVSSLLRGFICIDALDEFPTKHRPKLWDSLQRIIRECPNIRLFMTGRPHIREEVRKYFPGYPDQMSGWYNPLPIGQSATSPTGGEAGIVPGRVVDHGFSGCRDSAGS